MNQFDAVAILLIVFAVAAGFRSGALPQIGGVLGAIGGAAIGLVVVPAIAERLTQLDPLPRAVGVLSAILLAVAIGEVIGSALGSWVGYRLGRGVASALDRAAGGVVGFAQAILILWLAGGLLAAGPFPTLTGQAEGSIVVRTLARVLPPPTSFAGEIASVLNASGLPDVFVGLEPAPLPPVEEPSDPVVRAIGRQAQTSAALVEAAACDYRLHGTGFVVAEQYIVTNAHVVAGATGVRVRSDAAGEPGREAEVVLFDPDLDVAVLYVPGLHARALQFASGTAERGAIGAVLGHPGGGGLAVIPAAVAGTYEAVGRDIYDEDRVSRRILELRADVERGDSGGPLVLEDGTVGGVVFAESRSEPDVGYALTATTVASRIRPALGRTGSVSTGSCLQ